MHFLLPARNNFTLYLVFACSLTLSLFATEPVKLSVEFMRKNRFFHTGPLIMAHMSFDKNSFELHYDGISGVVPFEMKGSFQVPDEKTVVLERTTLKFDEWRAESYGRPEIPASATCKLQHEPESYNYEYILHCRFSEKYEFKFGISSLRVKSGEFRPYTLDCKEANSAKEKNDSKYCKTDSAKPEVELVIDRREVVIKRRCFLQKLPESNSTIIGENDETFTRMGSASGEPKAFYSGAEFYTMARLKRDPALPPEEPDWFLIRYNTVMGQDGGFANELWLSSECLQ